MINEPINGIIFHDISNNEVITTVPFKNNEFIAKSQKSKDIVLDLGEDLSCFSEDKLKNVTDLSDICSQRTVELTIYDPNVQRSCTTLHTTKENDGSSEASEENLSNEISSHKRKRNLRCNVSGCIKKFTNVSNLNVHQLCHRNDSKTFICSFCKQDFLRWMNCATHLWKAHQCDVDLFSCNVCKSYKSVIPEMLRRHYKIHLNEQQYVCKTCGKAFKQAPPMHNHELLHEKQANKDAHKCNCNKTFSSETSLKTHYQKCHAKSKLLICIICDYKTSRHSDFHHHQRTHTKEKPFKCHFCTSNFSDHNSLRRHKLTHMPKKHLRCPATYCSLETVHASVMRIHFKEQHTAEVIPEFSCLFCPISIKSLQGFITHSAGHEKEFLSGVKEEE